MARAKYGNRKTVVDGIAFASALEAKRYGQLRLMERAGAITELRLQPPIKCVVNGLLVCRYFPDFSYVANGARIYEDAKGCRTREYILKKKLVEALFPDIKIVEVTK